MLVLSRKPGESIVIDGRIHVTVIRVESGVVKLGILAPKEISVHRQEIQEEIRHGKQETLNPSNPSSP